MGEDPYYDFYKKDYSDIQVNVFRVDGPLRDLPTKNEPSVEKNKFLHKDLTIFNPKNIEITDILITKNKTVNEKIYLSDTIEILLNKIAIHCCDEKITGKDIFAWVDNNPKTIHSLRYCLPLGIQYNDLETYMNPYLDKKYDERFVNIDGSIKRNPKYSLDYFSSYGSYLTNINDYNIYFTTTTDILNYLSSDKINKTFKDYDENLILNGYLKKYFPLYKDNDEDYINKISQKLKFMKNQIDIQNKIIENPIDCRPNTIIYKNKIINNSLDIFKIFKEFELTENIPYIRIQIDNYLDSYIKLNKQIINHNYDNDNNKSLTKDIFEKFNKNIYTQNGFIKPKSIDKSNSLTFILYDNKTTNYVSMILYSDGRIELYCDKLMKIEKFTNKYINKFIEKSNILIRNLNKKNISYENVKIPLLKNKPNRIDISYIYEITDYNQNILSKPFDYFSSQFLIIENDDTKPLHILYCLSDNYENPYSILEFITILNKKQLPESKIKLLLCERYNLSKNEAIDNYNDWQRLNETQNIKIDTNNIIVSILIEKVLDRIKVSLIGINGYNQLHECMKKINFILGTYKEKKINKNKNLSKQILDLYKKNSTKNIITNIQTDIPDSPEIIEESIIEESHGEMVEDTRNIQYKDREDKNTEETKESEEESEVESEEESEGEYERMSSSDSQSGGGNMRAGAGKDKPDDESKYPNKRYFIKRLEQRDPALIAYKPRNPLDAYSKKCPATQDKQPIVLTKQDLEEIDHKTKDALPGGNAGVSYTKAYHVEGFNRPDLYYICPKYWDRKHQIPIDPKSLYHPIETDEEGNKTIEFRNFVYSRDDGEDKTKYILERSGKPANRTDNDSYWNRDYETKDDINKYNIQFIHDDVHPELLGLPCCGKNTIKMKQKQVNVLMINDEGKNYWAIGERIGEINNKDEYLININDEKKYYHISLLKPFKGTSYRISYDFPLKQNSNGHISQTLKDFFNMRKDAPFITEVKNKSKNGFYRKGISQNNDSFLESLDVIHCTNKNNNKIKRIKPNLDKFKKNLIKDINNINIDIFSISGGAFVQYFRDETIPENNIDLIRNSVLKNFNDYIYSNEPKDEKLLISVFMKISEYDKNLLFEGNKINIIVFHEYNEKISLINPIGNLDKLLLKDEYYSFIYKYEDKYEPILYYYNNHSYGYLLPEINMMCVETPWPPIKGNDILYQNMNAEFIKMKNDLCEIKILETDKILKNIPINDINHYDMKCIIDIIQDFIFYKSSKVISSNKEIITEDDLNLIMNQLNYVPLNKGYYDTYNRLIFVDYKENKKNSIKRLTIPIKPKSLSDESFQEKLLSCDNLPKTSLSHVLSYLNKIDQKIKEIFNDKYLSFNNKSKIILNNDKMIGLLLDCGLIIPLDNKKYNKKYKLETLLCSSSLDFQCKHLMGTQNEDELSKYYNIYNTEKQNLYLYFTNIYNLIKNDTKLYNNINTILKHPVKLLIHKRWELLDLLSNEDIKDKDIKLKKFIELLLINGIDEINKILIHKFISLKDLKLNNSETTVYFSMKDIINESYEYLFIKYSNYIRNISFYNEYNPKIQKKLLKKKFIEKDVSFITKYPNLLKKLFIGNMKVLKNISYEERNDIQILSDILLNIKPDITNIIIKDLLLTEHTTNKNSYKYQNLLLEDIYKSNDEFINDLDDNNYYLTSYDLKILSSIFKVGFVLFTNRYTNDENKFQTHIIIHKNLIKENINDLSLPMICFYQDFSENENNNKELKPIEIDEMIIHDLQSLQRNTKFKTLLNKTYKI